MAQIKTFSWTNPATAVAKNLDVGFDIAEITTVDVTNGGSFYWNSEMTDGYYLDVDAGTITTSNGFTPVEDDWLMVAPISAFTNANPGVITVSNVAQWGIAAGDTIAVVFLADDGTATSLNGTYTVASVTGTTITTTTNTSAYSVYVAGGAVRRISDAAGNPVATENSALQGITVGSGVVGQNNAVMTAVVKGANSVV